MDLCVCGHINLVRIRYLTRYGDFKTTHDSKDMERVRQKGLSFMRVINLPHFCILVAFLSWSTIKSSPLLDSIWHYETNYDCVGYCCYQIKIIIRSNYKKKNKCI